ncbi:MAG: hypothetical protein A2068_15175 [Ignavibacteria bacterium GWB2_35_6b]|nr:MAG: hypothetical protein A2068_15175 [Ignavibacteria bacterium GWB2_35_6b]
MIKLIIKCLVLFIFASMGVGCNNVTEPNHVNIYDRQNPNRTKIAPEIVDFKDFKDDLFKIYWTYPTQNHDGFIVERKVNNENFQEVFKASKNINSYTETPSKSSIYNYRIIATKNEFRSDYSNEIKAEYKNELKYNIAILNSAYHNHIGDLIAYAPDKKLAATFTDKINVINAQLPLAVVKQIPSNNGTPPNLIGFDDTGDYLIVIFSDNSVKIWETLKWNLSKEFTVNKKYTIGKFVKSDYILLAGTDNSIDVYNFQTGILVQSFLHSNIVTNLEYNMISNTVVSASKDGKITIWSLSNFQKILEHTIADNIDFISTAQDESQIIAVNSNKIILLNYIDLSIVFEYQRAEAKKIFNAFFEKEKNNIIFNTENDIYLLILPDQIEKKLHSFSTQYRSLFSDKRLNYFFIGGFPMILFNVDYQQGFWDFQKL